MAANIAVILLDSKWSGQIVGRVDEIGDNTLYLTVCPLQTTVLWVTSISTQFQDLLQFGQTTRFLKHPSWATPSMNGLRYSQIPRSAPLSTPSWKSLAIWQRLTEQLDLRPTSPKYSEAGAHIL